MGTIQYNTIQYNTIQFALHCNAIQYNTIQYNTTLQMKASQRTKLASSGFSCQKQGQCKMSASCLSAPRAAPLCRAHIHRSRMFESFQSLSNSAATRAQLNRAALALDQPWPLQHQSTRAVS